MRRNQFFTFSRLETQSFRNNSSVKFTSLLALDFHFVFQKVMVKQELVDFDFLF